MPGRVLRVVPRQPFDFTHLATASASETRTVASMDFSQYTGGALMVRVHNATFGTGSPSVTVRLLNDLTTDEDPANVFIEAFVLASATISSQGAGTLVVDNIDGWLASKFAVQVVGTQGSNNNQPIFAELSADLVLRAPS